MERELAAVLGRLGLEEQDLADFCTWLKEDMLPLCPDDDDGPPVVIVAMLLGGSFSAVLATIFSSKHAFSGCVRDLQSEPQKNYKFPFADFRIVFVAGLYAFLEAVTAAQDYNNFLQVVSAEIQRQDAALAQGV